MFAVYSWPGLQALACGTPIVTAGALQSVHRLAEGMIVAVAARECQDGEEKNSRQPLVDEPEPPSAKASGGKSTTLDPEQMGQQRARQSVVDEAEPNQAGGASDERATARRRTNTTCAHQRCGDGNIGAKTGHREGDEEHEAAGPARTGDAAAIHDTEDDDNVLVESLVAETVGEYILKAVAIAAPGALKEQVRQALRCRRDGILQGGGGDGDVAVDWEVFLTRIAASANTDGFV